MNVCANDFYELIRREPFEPFRVHMVDGSHYDVVHPRLTLVLPSYVYIGIKDPAEPDPIADDDIRCWYDQISRTELLKN